MADNLSRAFSLQCGSRTLDLSEPRVMGVLNVTPDSFSDGGSFNKLDHALVHAEAMIQAGAAIVDVGGESTRPGARPVGVQEELDRVVPVVEAISQRLDVVISVDTSTPQVMREVARAGAGLLNDVRALQREGALEAAAQTGLPLCLMHMQGQPDSMQDNPAYGDVVTEITDFLERRMQDCVAMGIPRERLLVDPGFGFGKTLEHNLRMLNRLERFAGLGVPLLVGMSRKSMIGHVLGKPVEQRMAGSLAVAVMAAMKGAHIIRVHDVAETVDAVKMARAVAKEQI